MYKNITCILRSQNKKRILCRHPSKNKKSQTTNNQPITMKENNTFKLQKLIKSLKKEEKRSFKLFAQKYTSKEENIYIKIFNYLDKVKQLDKEKFKLKFNYVKGLSGIQRYLYLQIMKNLRANQKSKANSTILLLEGMTDLEILFNKELVYLAQEKLEELISIAIFHDKISYLPLLYEWWFKLGNTRFRYRNISSSRLDDFILLYKESIDQLYLLQTYQTTLSKVLVITHNKNNKQKAETKIKTIETKLPSYYTTDLKNYSFSIVLEELQLRRYIASILNDRANSYHLSSQTCHVIKEQPTAIFEAYKKHYYIALQAKMHNTTHTDSVTKILEELRTASIKEADQINDFMRMGFAITQLDITILSQKFEQSLKCILETKSLIKKIKKTSPTLGFSIWYYKVAIYYFSIQDYDQALHIIEEELNTKHTLQIVKHNGLLLKAIIYYEKEEYIFLSSFLANIRRLLRNEDALLIFERIVLTLIAKLIKVIPAQQQELFIIAQKEIIKCFEQSSFSDRKILTFFNYVGWIDSKINHTKFKVPYFRHVGTIPF